MPRHPAYAVLALSLLLACGDDDSGRPRYTVQITGVNGVMPVAGLGVGDQRALCQSYDAYVEAYVDLGSLAYLSCLPQALLLGGSREGCEQSLSQCVSAFPDPIAVRASANAVDVCVTELASCQANVADLEGCINLNLDLLFEILEDWSCALYGDDAVQTQAQEMMNLVQVCADLNAACNAAATPLGPD